MRQINGQLVIVESSTGEVVAEHKLAAPGTASMKDEHYGGERPAPQRAPRPKTTVEQQFCTLGPSAEQFLVGAAAIGNTRLGSELALGAAYGSEALIGALIRAVAFRRFRASDVRSILAAGAGTPITKQSPQPRPAGEALILDLPICKCSCRSGPWFSLRSGQCGDLFLVAVLMAVRGSDRFGEVGVRGRQV